MEWAPQRLAEVQTQATVAKRTFGFGDNSRLTRYLHAYSRQIRAVHFVVDVWLHNKNMAKAPHFS